MTRDTNEPPHPHLRPRDRTPVLERPDGFAGHGHGPVAGPRLSGGRGDRGPASRGGEPSVPNETLDSLVLEVLEEIAGERYAENFLRWQEVQALDIPLVVLIGGTTGVGKSTIATQLAARLGIVRVWRQRCRPGGHAGDVLARADALAPRRRSRPMRRCASRRGREAVIVGFREQTAAVAVGIQALVERAAVEGTDTGRRGRAHRPGVRRPVRVAGRSSSFRWSSPSRTRTCTAATSWRWADHGAVPRPATWTGSRTSAGSSATSRARRSPRRPRRAQLRLRPGARRGHRPGGGAGDGAGGRASADGRRPGGKEGDRR